MLPLWDTQRNRRTPVITALLIGTCLAVFAYECVLLLQDEVLFRQWIETHALVPGRLLNRWEEPAQWQTVLSSLFLHGGVAHVLGNCWFLWVFGNNVEDRLGFFRFVLLYLGCGVAASAAQAAFDLSSTVPLIGASGAISGVLGAYLVFFPRAWVVSLVPWVVPILPIPAVVFLPMWFFVQAYSGLGAMLDASAADGGVAWWAHVGGFVAGVVFALTMPSKRRV